MPALFFFNRTLPPDEPIPVLDHAMMDIFDATREGFDRIVVLLDGKDGIFVEVVDLFEDV
jgi:hypothetical protein